MGLTNPGRAFERFSLLLISLKLSTRVWHLTLFHKLSSAGLPPCFARWTRSFLLIGALAWFIKITKVVPFGSVEVFLKDWFLALYFFSFSSMIFLLLCLPSAALFMLTIWPFGPPPPWSLLLWRPHKELCVDWSAGLSTGVFLSIRANYEAPSQWIPIKLTSSPTSSYSISASV